MRFPLAFLFVGCVIPGVVQSAETLDAKELELEKPNLPPGRPASDDAFARSPGRRIAFGSYETIQINVDAAGNNIMFDAANEPSLAVNPLNPANMVVGWRQFDTVYSDFRQAGWAHTFDGGQSWTFPGVLTPGTFRSDPVLDVNAQGTFFFQSITILTGGNYEVDVFRSYDGGVTWSDPVYEFGGDKNWLAVDRTGGPSDGFLYGTWQRFGAACCGHNIFTRSTNDGDSFETPVPVVYSPLFGTSTVGPDGTFYLSGVEGIDGQNFSQYVLARSRDARQAQTSPNFSVTRVNLGGEMRLGGPNPSGLLGQAQVLINPAPGPRHGEVYVFGTVMPTGSFIGTNVHVIRSEIDGDWFYPPVVVNDDGPRGAPYQWMAAASIAPNGRLDAIWYDTRIYGQSNIAQLYYAYSWDGGQTWSPNVAVTPPFDTSVGYPVQQKMGDYSGIVSDVTGAHAAFAATFNNEQDVYYVRLFPDCNGNGTSDVTDLAGTSMDCDANHVPDECQTAPQCLGAGAVASGALTVDRVPGGDLTLQWGASCGAGDDDYAVYEGTLGSFSSHVARQCTTAGATTQVLTPALGDTYYLIVPTHADREGSYGTNGAGVERPVGQSACFLQAIQACSP